jgi:hypothetical protein
MPQTFMDFSSRSAEGPQKSMAEYLSPGDTNEKASRKSDRAEMFSMYGTGFPAVKQPAQPDRKIYPTQCKECGGKGRITQTAN